MTFKSFFSSKTEYGIYTPWMLVIIKLDSLRMIEILKHTNLGDND